MSGDSGEPNPSAFSLEPHPIESIENVLVFQANEGAFSAILSLPHLSEVDQGGIQIIRSRPTVTLGASDCAAALVFTKTMTRKSNMWIVHVDGGEGMTSEQEALLTQAYTGVAGGGEPGMNAIARFIPKLTVLSPPAGPTKGEPCLSLAILPKENPFKPAAHQSSLIVRWKTVQF